MISRHIFSSICIAIVLIASTECGPMPLRNSRHTRHPISYQPSAQSLANPYFEDMPPPPPRHIHRYHETNGTPTRETDSRSGPERGQILHRPKSNEKKRYPKSQNSQPQSASDAGPIFLNRGKNVKYVPLQGSNGYQSGGGGGNNNNNQQDRPSVYVINGGSDEDENEGIMGSMQTYFKSFRGRIKSAMQGIIGQEGDDRQLS